MFHVNQLIGFGPKFNPNLSFVTSGDGNNGTVTIPGTPTAGDFCVIWNTFRNTVVSAGAASGFTSLVFTDASGTGEGGGRIQAKILNGSETTVSIETGSNSERWICATFRPTSKLGGFTANDTAGQATNGDPTGQTINAANAQMPHLLLANFAKSGTQIIGTMTKLTNSNTEQFSAYEIVNPGDTPADVTVDQSDDGASQNLLQSCYVTFY